MKKLIFVRHGRAEEQVSSFTDYERSLTNKGKSVSEQMALRLKEKETTPAVFVTSPAFRAYETALVFARVLGYDPDKIILKNTLYTHANLKSFAGILDEISDDTDCIIFFGHNPAFTEMPDRLSRSGIDFVPKSGVVCLSFKTETWKGLLREKGTIDYFLKPDKTL